MIRKTLKWFRRLMLALIVLMALLWLAQCLLLPAIIRSQVIARLEVMGLTPASVEVDHVSLTSATLRNLSAGNALSARIIHVTYTPADLFSGRVNDIIIQGATIRPVNWPSASASTSAAPATQPVTFATEPPFSKLSITESSIEVPLPSLPTRPATVPFELEAAGRDHRIVASTFLSMPGYSLDIHLDADPAFRSINTDLHATADLSQLPQLLAQKDLTLLTLQGNTDLKLSATLAMGPQLAWDIKDLRVVTHLAEVRRNAMHLKDLDSTLHLRIQGQGKHLNVDLLDDSRFAIASVSLSPKWPVFPVVFEPKSANLQFWGNDWRLLAQNANLAVGDVKLELLPGWYGMRDGQPYGQINSLTDLNTVGQSRLLRTIWPMLAKFQLGGQIHLQLDRIIDPNNSKPSLSATLMKGKLGSPDYELEADGIEGSVTFIDLSRAHSLPAQQLKMGYGKMGKWEIRDGLFQFTMPNLTTMKVEKTQLGWLGGNLWAAPFTLELTNPIIRSRVYGKDLDLGKLVWVLAGEKAWAEGSVELDVPLVLRWPDMRFGDGYIQARPGGKLHLDYAADKLKQYLNATDPRFATDETYRTIRDRMVTALQDFQFSRLRAGMVRKDNVLRTELGVTGKGASEGGQELNLNVAVTDLDWFISSYLGLKRQQP